MAFVQIILVAIFCSTVLSQNVLRPGSGQFRLHSMDGNLCQAIPPTPIEVIVGMDNITISLLNQNFTGPYKDNEVVSARTLNLQPCGILAVTLRLTTESVSAGHGRVQTSCFGIGYFCSFLVNITGFDVLSPTLPTAMPTAAPSEPHAPSDSPTDATPNPTQSPIEFKTKAPSSAPTDQPTGRPTPAATRTPTASNAPTARPTGDAPIKGMDAVFLFQC
jgi:hypothetical protein